MAIIACFVGFQIVNLQTKASFLSIAVFNHCKGFIATVEGRANFDGCPEKSISVGKQNKSHTLCKICADYLYST